MASNTSSSTSSDKSDNSIKANHKNTDAKFVTSKRRRQSGRQDNVLERHRHHSVHKVYYGQGPGQGTLQARDRARDAGEDYGQGTGQGTPQARDQARDATGAGQDDERDDDQDAIDPRRDIQARLRRASNVIIADTYANRPQRARSAIDKYQAGTKKVTKRLGRGRGRGRD